RVAAEASRREQNPFARFDIERCAVSRDPGANDATVLDEQVVHRGAGPDRGSARSSRMLLSICPMIEAPFVSTLRPRSRAAWVRRKTLVAKANARGERLKYCTLTSSLVITTNPRFQFLSIV